MTTHLPETQFPSEVGGVGITLVGLGPGRWEHLTIEAWEVLCAASTIYLRTMRHPTVDELRRRLPGAQLISFDDVYEQATTFDAVYDEIATRLLDLGRRAAAEGTPAVYAMPGHPLIGERVASLLMAQAPGVGVALRVVEGLSFLEPVITALGFDPLGSGLVVIDAASLADAPQDWDGANVDVEPDPRATLTPSPRLVQTGQPLLLAQLYSSAVASAAKLWLLERYPPNHPCVLLRAAGCGSEARRHDVLLAELDYPEAQASIDYLTTLYVPPLEWLHDLRSPLTLAGIVARLRAPNGCPWDREQDHQSLKPHLLEETYEVLDALDRQDWDNLVEELGDLLLQIVMHAQFAEEAETFDLGDVAQGINAKLVRRHPHVFGSVEAGTSSQVLANWDAIKRAEKTAANGGREGEPASFLDRVPRALPALAAAQTFSRKAARAGFEWPSLAHVYAKLSEEIAEVQAATSVEHRREELGDVLFVVVNLCRLLGVEAEEAQRLANRKFADRYALVERLGLRQGRNLSSLSPAELQQLWAEAKRAASASN